MTFALVVLGIVLSVVAGYASDALGLPPLGRGLVVGVVIGLTVLLASRRMRRNERPVGEGVSDDEDMRPLGDRTPGQRAISNAIFGGFMAVGTLLAAVGGLGNDRPVRLALIYVIGPPVALYFLALAGKEAWIAAQQRRRDDK